MPYDVYEHRHRFAIWAAARAAQRGSTGANMNRLHTALTQCGVVRFAQSRRSLNTPGPEFERLHRKWCRCIIQFTRAQDGMATFTFGRAAKLVAVYLKVMITLGSHHESRLARVAHSPIDRRLLINIARRHDVAFPRTPSGAIKGWSTLTEQEYNEVIGELRNVANGRPLWELEEYWPDGT